MSTNLPNFAALSARVPIALLPVRIETRFIQEAAELRVRVYPDPLHVDTHEPELAPEEVSAGKAYWSERWAAHADTSRTAAAWNELARAFGPRRALWVAHSLTPVNIAQIGAASPEFPQPDGRPGTWTRAAYASLLPDQWVVAGFRGGMQIFRKAGAAVPERLVIGPDPNAQETVEETDTLALDEASRWLADYDSAAAVGMGITITNADAGGTLGSGVDQLIVIGVNTRLAPEAGGGAVADALRAHVYTDGLSVVPPGAPTNNTEAARTGDPDPVEALTRELDPTVPRVLDAESGGRALERAFGISENVVHLHHSPAAAKTESRTVSLLIDVLWSATLGYYLDQLLEPLVDDATIARLRAHARDFLRPGGPLPVIRIGKQPYGVLPILSFARFRPDSDVERTLQAALARLRPFWDSATRQVPRLGAAGDPDTELLQLLQMVPLSAAARFRRVLGPELEPNTQGLATHALAQQYYAGLVTQLAFGLPARPRVASFTADPRDRPLRVPWVQPGEPGDAPLEPNYLAEIAGIVRANGGRALLNERDNAGALLQALTANAALNEFDLAASRVVHAHQVRVGAASSVPLRASFRAPEAVRMLGPTTVPATPGVAGPVTVETPGELSGLVLPATTGTQPLGTWIAARLRVPGRAPVQLRDLVQFLDSVDALSTRPAGEIDRALRGVLDACSHRLDAWLTSLAAARLAALREASPHGVYVGGYGWVEGLRPESGPESLGYVHAPSLEQASAAAILRSGHLAHRDSEHQTMNVDLRSDRVRLALGILEGVAQGQPLAALLGYRIERALRDRDPRLARFIAPLRRLAPLRPSGEGSAAQPAEAIAARDVVDGVALLEQWRASEAGVLDAIAVPAGDRQAVAAELRRLADALDAVSDLLVAESVYQTTTGNHERARAALAVLDRQERPPDVQVVRTPRSGVTYTQRLLVVLGEDTPAAAWRPLDDPRAAAEPRLNAWIARLLGTPTRYRFSGRILSDNAPPRDVQLQLRQLGLSPLSLVLAARRGGPDRASELEERIALGFAAHVRAADVNPRLEIDAGPPAAAPNAVGLGPLLVMLEWLGRLVGARAADARDFALPESTVDAGIDVAELAARADGAVASFESALAALEAALPPAPATEETLRAALEGAAAVGVAHAVPRAIVPAGSGDAATAPLADLGNEVLARMRASRAALEALGSPASDPASLAAHHVARIQTVFGEDVPVLPRFTLPNAAELSASLADVRALCGGDRLAPLGWLQRMALVRPEADTLQRVLTAAELVGGPVAPADLRVAQMPHVSGQRWAALPQHEGVAVSADLALALHVPGRPDLSGPLAAIACDEWAETIPAAEETTGLSFHYDAPGARAPNAVLLAVPADRDATAWSVDEVLDVVREAAALAAIRLVGPRQLHALGILLPTTYLPWNSRRDVPSVDVDRLTAGAAGNLVLGKSL